MNYFSKPDSSPQTQDIRQEFNFTDSQFLRVFPGIQLDGQTKLKRKFTKICLVNIHL